jgi:hypothetical protein
MLLKCKFYYIDEIALGRREASTSADLEHSRCPGRGLKRVSPECKSRALPLDQAVR